MRPGLLALVALAIAATGCAGGGTAMVPSEDDVVPSADAVAVSDGSTVVAPSTASGGATVALSFDEFYSGYSVREGLELSERLRSLDGARVRMQGYMAPPLKPALDFFVLTRIRLAVCPFCSTAGDWPNDIALVYVLGEPMKTTARPLAVEGRLELGVKRDPEVGMVSLVRIYADRVEKL